MAKMKVHELAKELQKQSKEILAFLQEQGIEAKAPQSTLEEDTVALVRKSFGADTGKTEEKNSFEGQNEGDEIDFDYFKINNWDELIEKIETI